MKAKIVNRYSIMKWHMLLGGFVLPLTLIYLIGGVLYVMDIKGHIDKQEFTLQLKQPFKADLDLLTQLTEQALLERGLTLPDSEPSLKKKKGLYELRWSDIPTSVTLQGSPDRPSVSLVFKRRSLLTQLMRIHRAEASSAFKVFSVIMVAGLLLVLFTGFTLAISIPRFRRPLAISTLSGLLLFFILFSI